MDNKDVAVWSCSRLASSQCPNKMIRPFHDTTLADIFLSKLSSIEQDTFFAGYEDVFETMCDKHAVPFVKRTRQSTLVDEPASEIYSFLGDQPYDYFLQVSSCAPFLRSKLIVEFLESCLSDRRPALGVFRIKDYFVRLDGSPINFSENVKTINTKSVSPLYEFGHIFYFFSKEHFMRTGSYWDWSEVRYIEIPKGLETFYIDTEEEFFMAESIWKDIGRSVR